MIIKGFTKKKLFGLYRKIIECDKVIKPKRFITKTFHNKRTTISADHITTSDHNYIRSQDYNKSIHFKLNLIIKTGKSKTDKK